MHGNVTVLLLQFWS